MTELTVKEGDTLPTATKTLNTAEAIDTGSGGSATLYVQDGQDNLIVNDTATVDDDTTGSADVSYQFSASQTANVGTHFVEWVVTYPDGDTQTFPADGYDTVTFTEQLNRGGSVTSALANRAGPLDVIEFNELGSDPSAPSTDDWALFFKTDGNLYKIDENGTVTQVGGGGSASISVEDDGTEIVATVGVFNFAGGQFDVTNPSGDEVQVVIGTDVIGTDELDLAITPTWTGLHTFDGGLALHDDDTVDFGTNNDFSIFYDATADAWKLRDKQGNQDLLTFSSDEIIVGDSRDIRLQSGTVANILDARSTDGHIGIGSAAEDDVQIKFDPPAETINANVSFSRNEIKASGALTVQGSTTSPVVAALEVEEPNLSLSTGASVTDAATVHVISAPTEGDTNHALWVETGRSTFGGDIYDGAGNLIYDASNNEIDAGVITDSDIDHDVLTNFVANEHIDHSTVSITAGDGLTGGGDLTATRTLSLDVPVEDGGAQVNTFDTLDFGTDLSVTDNGDGSATVDSTASGGSGSSWSQTTKTSDYAASDNDSVWVDASSAAVTITLPSPSQSVHVRVIATDATNTVTVSRNGSENINGDASDLTLEQDESVTLESDGTNWRVV